MTEISMEAYREEVEALTVSEYVVTWEVWVDDDEEACLWKRKTDSTIFVGTPDEVKEFMDSIGGKSHREYGVTMLNLNVTCKRR